MSNIRSTHNHIQFQIKSKNENENEIKSKGGDKSQNFQKER